MSDMRTYWEDRIASHGRHRGIGTCRDPESVNRARKEALFHSIEALLDNSTIETLSGLDLLDAGCGTGIYADYLSKQGGNVCGFDFSRAALDHATTNGATASYVQGSITDIPYQDDRFDISFCLSVLYHLIDDEDWVAAIQELSRVTSPGGHLVLRINWEERRFGDGEHFQERPRSEYLDLLSDYGFELRDVIPILDDPKYPDWLPVQLKRMLGPAIIKLELFEMGRNRLLLFSHFDT